MTTVGIQADWPPMSMRETKTATPAPSRAAPVMGSSASRTNRPRSSALGASVDSAGRSCEEPPCAWDGAEV
ncbi:hypothetical protein GCM10027447_14100 [Glycomyces halotolerans]